MCGAIVAAEVRGMRRQGDEGGRLLRMAHTRSALNAILMRCDDDDESRAHPRSSKLHKKHSPSKERASVAEHDSVFCSKCKKKTRVLSVDDVLV